MTGNHKTQTYEILRWLSHAQRQQHHLHGPRHVQHQHIASADPAVSVPVVLPAPVLILPRLLDAMRSRRAYGGATASGPETLLISSITAPGSESASLCDSEREGLRRVLYELMPTEEGVQGVK